jgi:hypothetical protein
MNTSVRCCCKCAFAVRARVRPLQDVHVAAVTVQRTAEFHRTFCARVRPFADVDAVVCVQVIQSDTRIIALFASILARHFFVHSTFSYV